MAAEQPVLAKDVPVLAVPQFGPNSKVNWDNPANAPTQRPHIGAGHVAQVPGAQFGPGSKVNWDNAKTDPNKRKNIGLDPGGTANAKLV